MQLRQKRDQDNIHINFKVNGLQYKQDQSTNINTNSEQKQQSLQQDISQYQNGGIITNWNNFMKGSNAVSSSNINSQAKIINSQQLLGTTRQGALFGKKIDSINSIQILQRSSQNLQPNMLYQNGQFQMQNNIHPQKETENTYQIQQVQTNDIQKNLSNSSQEQILSSNSHSNHLKKKYSYPKDQTVQFLNSQNIQNTDENTQTCLKKKRPASSMNQNQLKTIQDHINKISSKTRSSSNSPSKDIKSRSASKKKQQERSSKKLQFQTIEQNKVSNGNTENQENEGIQNLIPQQKEKVITLKKKKKSSSSVHINPVSKQNHPQQISASKSRSPNTKKKNIQTNEVQNQETNVLGEKNLNSPVKIISSQAQSSKKSPSNDEKQKKKKKNSQMNQSKSKSNKKINHTKSLQILIIGNQQSSQEQQISQQQQISQLQSIVDQSKFQSQANNHLKEVENLIKKNAQKIQLEQFVKKQEEIEEKNKCKQEEEKRKILNETIRKENLMKFCKIKQSSKDKDEIQPSQFNLHLNTSQLQQKYAWGTNQQRIKMHQIISTQQSTSQPQQMHEKSQNNHFIEIQRNSSPQYDDENLALQQLKEKKRREQSGLSFLNSLNESFIKKKLEHERIKQEQSTHHQLSEEYKKKHSFPPNHEEIKKFMIFKKKKFESETKKRKEEKKEREERLKNNLQILDQEIKNSRSNNSVQVQEKDKLQGIIGLSNQRSKSSTQRKKKNRTFSSPNLEKFLNKTENQTIGNDILETFVKKYQPLQNFSQTQKISQKYLESNKPDGTFEEEEGFLQNNYFSNTQQQYSRKYEPIGSYKFFNHQRSANNNLIRQTNETNEENFEMLNKEFKKMFNITGSYIDDRNLMEFSQSINRTQQLATTMQTNNASNRLGSSGKKGKKKQNDFIKPKSISMHASNSVGNFKVNQVFDSSHFGNVQNIQSQSQRLKEINKERSNYKKNTHNSQANSISPDSKVLKNSITNKAKSISQHSFSTTGINALDNAFKKQQQNRNIEVQEQQNAVQFTNDKYIQDLIKLKRDQLKLMYSQQNNKINQDKSQPNKLKKNGYPQYDDIQQEDKYDQQNFEQNYFNYPINNMKIQQIIQQSGNSNSLGSLNNSYRKAHISNASPIKEEPEEEDNGNFSNINIIHPNNNNNNQQKQGQNQNIQKIHQNNKNEFINSDSSNNTIYPQKVNNNPYSNESDQNSVNQIKEFSDKNNQKNAILKNNNIQFPATKQANSNVEQIQVNMPINPLSSLSKISPPSKNKSTPSASMSSGGLEYKKNEAQIKHQELNFVNNNNNLQVQPVKAHEFIQPKEDIFKIHNNQSQLNQGSSQVHFKNMSSSIQPADPNAPVSIHFKETIQSKSYISSRNDQRNSQLQEADFVSDPENGMITSKELQPQLDQDMPILPLPLNLNFQYRVQQMKKRTHNTDNEEMSPDQISKIKLSHPIEQVQAQEQLQKKPIDTKQKDNVNQQVQEGLAMPVTSKTPQSSQRDESNKINSQSIYNQQLEKDYQQFKKEEDIKLDLLKETQTQNQISQYFGSQDESQVNRLSAFSKSKDDSSNPSNFAQHSDRNDLRFNKGGKQPDTNQEQQISSNENNQNIPNHLTGEEEEGVDVDYLYDLDYDQLQELKMIIFQGDPENPEIQALSEQLILYDAAATIIQKVFRGFFTRKCIFAILEYQRQQEEEEERLYQEAEKFLEDNHIEPEELLEGNPIPLTMQQNHLPYHSSDQLKEYEQREQQLNNDRYQQQIKNQNSESNQLIKIKEYSNEIQDQGILKKVADDTNLKRENQVISQPFTAHPSMPERLANQDLYHQKDYNDDLKKPKKSDFIVDFDFNDSNSPDNAKNIDKNNKNQSPQSISQNKQIDRSKFDNNNNKKDSQIQDKREQQIQFNQLNLKEINEQSKSLDTVKEFDISLKDKMNTPDYQNSQFMQQGGKTFMAAQNESNLQIEMTKLQEQAKMWNQMINQIISLPQDQSQQFKDNALKMLSNLQKQSEMSKQILIENIKLKQQIPKSPLNSTDRFPLSELGYIEDKVNQNSSDSQQNRDSSSKDLRSQSSQNPDTSKISSNQVQPHLNNYGNQLEKGNEEKKLQSLNIINPKKNLKLDIDQMDSNYNEKIQNEQFRKQQISQKQNEQDKSQNLEEYKNNKDSRRQSFDSSPFISQEQRAMARALSVSSIESNELRYANIVQNNSFCSGSNKERNKGKQVFLDRFNNDNILNSNSKKNSHAVNESISSMSSSFFDKQPFKEFTTKILQKFTIPQESVDELIKTREEAIEYKHKTQMDLIKKMHERNRISPKSFEKKQFELEKWVSAEREDLKNVKKEIERGWEKFAQAIKQTKRDLEFMEQTKRIDTNKLLQSNEEDQLRRLLSMRSESEHSIEEYGTAERRSIEGLYQFKPGQEDPNKIKIVNQYKPSEHSSLSSFSSQNNRNRNNSDIISQTYSSRSRNLSLPVQNQKEEYTQPQDQVFEIFEDNILKQNPLNLNDGLQQQLSSQNQQIISKQQVNNEFNSESEQQNNKGNATLENRARRVSSNGSSIQNADEEPDQFLPSEKNKTEESISMTLKKAFEQYNYSNKVNEEDDSKRNTQTQKSVINNDKLEIQTDQNAELSDRLDISPIFAVPIVSKQGLQEKSSLKLVINNNSNTIKKEQSDAIKIESDINQKGKPISQELKTSTQANSQKESAIKQLDTYSTVEGESEIRSKKQSDPSKIISPKVSFMRGDFLQEDDIESKVNYISDQTLNHLVDDTAQDLKSIQDKNKGDEQKKEQIISESNFKTYTSESTETRQNNFNFDDFPENSERTSSLETSQGVAKGQSQQKAVVNNNNNQEIDLNKQKNSLLSSQNSPNSLDKLTEISNDKVKSPFENDFNIEDNDIKQNKQLDQRQQLSLSQENLSSEDERTQNSQQQLQYTEQLLSTQNNQPGLECATLNFIKDYLVSFSEFIKDNFTEEFLERVNIPLGMDPQEFLKTFTITETINNGLGEISAAPIYPIVKYIHMQNPVVSEDLFARFNEIFNRERDMSMMTEDLYELEKFHMRMIFDCFNEALDSMRPFGLRGKPLPWKINSNKLSSIIITPDNIEKILGLAIAKVLKWGSFLCGFIPERIESPTGEVVQIEDDYLNQIKEDRLAQMLENEVIENEDKWLTYEDEETDVELEIADDIFNYLVEEAASMLLNNLQNGSDLNTSSNELTNSNKLERNLSSNYEGLSKNIFGNPNITKGNKKQIQGGGIRPINDLGISQQLEQEKKQMKKQMFLRNLQSGSLPTPLSQNDALNSSF